MYGKFFTVGPNITGYCSSCGERYAQWFSRADIGLGPRKRKRSGSKARSDLLARWGHRCAWCGISAWALQEHGEELVEGHIVPHHTLHTLPDVQNHPANLVPSCNACNDFAHEIGKNERLFDLSILLHAAVAYAAGKLGGRADERGGESDNHARPVRAPVRADGLAGIPVSGGREASPDRARLARGDNGRDDDPETVA
jgi:5-methylcytosine-specific restriction endonuclease McrA